MMFSDLIVLFVAPMLEASLIITSTLQKRKKRKRLSASSGKLLKSILKVGNHFEQNYNYHCIKQVYHLGGFRYACNNV